MALKEQRRVLGMFLGQVLKEYRQKQAIKQQELADLLSIDERTLRRWEQGHIPRNVDELKRIADLLGIDYERLGIASSLSVPQTCEQVDEAIEQIWSRIKQAQYLEARTLAEKLIQNLTLQITTVDSRS